MVDARSSLRATSVSEDDAPGAMRGAATASPLRATRFRSVARKLPVRDHERLVV